MKKTKKIIILILSALMIILQLPISASADETVSGNSTLYEQLLSAGELNEISVDDIFDDWAEEIDLSVVVADNIDNDMILDELSLNANDVDSFKKVEYEYNDDIAFEAEFNDGTIVDYDEDMNIIAYSNFERNTETSITLDDNNLIDVIKEEFNIDDSYVVEVDDNDNGDTVYYWEKVDDNGYRNIYDSLSVRIDGSTEQIVTMNRFDDTAETEAVNIDEETAKQLALNVSKDFQSVTSIEKEYVKPNFFWNEEGKAYENADVVKLAYSVTVDDINLVYVDCETGEIIGGDVYKAVNNCGTYAYSGFSYSTASRNLAKTYLVKLGYTSSSTSVGSSGLRAKVLDFVTNDLKAYGFYIDCHGSSTTLATDSTTILKKSEVVGNWHFVFLDACETAANTNWSNAFKISSSYSKRAFFGWKTSVTVGNAYSYCSAFWPETYNRNHSNNVRDAAVWAAAQVPGSGTTPIKFYGDTSYNGKAY